MEELVGTRIHATCFRFPVASQAGVHGCEAPSMQRVKVKRSTSTPGPPFTSPSEGTLWSRSDVDPSYGKIPVWDFVKCTGRFSINLWGNKPDRNQRPACLLYSLGGRESRSARGLGDANRTLSMTKLERSASSSARISSLSRSNDGFILSPVSSVCSFVFSFCSFALLLSSPRHSGEDANTSLLPQLLQPRPPTLVLYPQYHFPHQILVLFPLIHRDAFHR